MYEEYFGLQRNPFSLTADPRSLFLTPSHREALAGLLFAMLRRKGLATLIGEAGTGKTTLLRKAIESLPRSLATFSFVLSPSLSPSELLEMVLLEFGLEDIADSKTRRLIQFYKFLQETEAGGKAAVLVIDEAQRLSPDVLEEIRLMTNLESSEGKLLQIIMAAQPELDDMLGEWRLRQIKQRIACRFVIQPLRPEQIEAYVRCRWSFASGSREAPFTEDALDYLTVYSGGIPRVINSICDNALLLAFSEKRPLVWPEDIVIAAKELALCDWSQRMSSQPGPVTVRQEAS